MSPRRTLTRLGLLTAGLAIAVLAAGCSAASVAPQAPDLAGRGATDSYATNGGAPAGVSKEGGPQGAVTPASESLVAGSQVIRTGSLQLQVTDVQAAVDAAKTAITGLGGYVSNSRQSAGDNQPVAVITYRIPAEKWDESLVALRKLATKVVDEITDSQDVTSQLVDIDARLKNLRASETALQEIAAKATRVTDVLEVQQQLTNVRGQIESLAAQQKALQGQVSFATVTVTYGLQLGAINTASRQWDPAREVDQASASLINLLQGVASGAIWFVIVWVPGLLLLAVLLLVLRAVARRLDWHLPRGGPDAPATGWVGQQGPGAGAAPTEG